MAKALKTVGNDLLEQRMQEAAGQGVSRDRADVIIPAIKILQGLSPMVSEGKGKPGDFVLPDNSLVPGTEGIWVQPCCVGDIWLEFTPREKGGGFVGQHPWRGLDRMRNPIPPEGSEQVGMFKHIFPERGTNVDHWKQWVVIHWRDQTPAESIISLYSTGHTVSKQWNTMSLTINRLADGNPRPLYGQVYHLTTRQKRGAKGSWYLIDPSRPTPLGMAEDIVGDPMRAFEMGEQLFRAFSSGERPMVSDEIVSNYQETDTDSEVM
jgi:hypothetical protein